MSAFDAVTQYWIAAALALGVGSMLSIRWFQKARRILGGKGRGCGSKCGGGCGASDRAAEAPAPAARPAEFVRFLGREDSK